MLSLRPQATFDDLYSSVYAVLDDAKTDHDLVKVYKGSHASPDPHPTVAEFGAWFFTHQRGLLAYACHQANPDATPTVTVADLETFDATHRPRIPTRAAFTALASILKRPGESLDDLLGYVTGRTHALGAYRGGSSGYDDESRALAATHFTHTGIATYPRDVLIFTGGAKGVFLCACAALMCTRNGEALQHLGGRMLAPAGYYQSLRLIPSVFGAAIDVTSDLCGETVAAWLADTDPHHPRVLYVPLVNNATGAVLDRDRAHGIARAVLEHNERHPDAPVYVIGDDVYVDAYLDPDVDACPIGSVSGDQLGIPEWPSMNCWTVSVVTPSKTFALPTSRTAFATTGNRALRDAIAHYRTVLSFGRVPQVSELTGIAAITLTPRAWITGWNRQFAERVRQLAEHLQLINAEVGMHALHITPPDGGWYVSLRINPALFPPGTVTSSLDAFAAMLHYSPHRDSGIGALPGELFGTRTDTSDCWYALRVNVAVDEHALFTLVDRLRAFVLTVAGSDGHQAITAAIARAHTVADLPRIRSRTEW